MPRPSRGRAATVPLREGWDTSRSGRARARRRHHGGRDAPAGSQSSPPVTTISLQAPTAYTPHPPNGGTDDYHCTLLNPHVTENSFIVSSDFYPNSNEVHHAILFLVPPALAAQAEAADGNGQGLDVFRRDGTAGSRLGPHRRDAVVVSVGARSRRGRPSRRGRAAAPRGQPRGHADPLQPALGDKPVRAKLVLHTVPSSTPLRPLSLALMPAPPDIPCPTGVTGPLCNRAPHWPTWASASAPVHRIRRTASSRVRAQPGGPARRGHHVVQLAGLAGGNHRAGRRPHAPPRTVPADRPEPGEARRRRRSSTSPTTTSTTSGRTTWRSLSRSCPATSSR